MKIIDLYQLKDKIKNGFVYYEIICRMYGLHKLPKKQLKIRDYVEADHTPGLFEQAATRRGLV